MLAEAEVEGATVAVALEEAVVVEVMGGGHDGGGMDTFSTKQFSR